MKSEDSVGNEGQGSNEVTVIEKKLPRGLVWVGNLVYKVGIVAFLLYLTCGVLFDQYLSKMKSTLQDQLELSNMMHIQSLHQIEKNTSKWYNHYNILERTDIGNRDFYTFAFQNKLREQHSLPMISFSSNDFNTSTSHLWPSTDSSKECVFSNNKTADCELTSEESPFRRTCDNLKYPISIESQQNLPIHVKVSNDDTCLLVVTPLGVNMIMFQMDQSKFFCTLSACFPNLTEINKISEVIFLGAGSIIFVLMFFITGIAGKINLYGTIITMKIMSFVLKKYHGTPKNKSKETCCFSCDEPIVFLKNKNAGSFYICNDCYDTWHPYVDQAYIVQFLISLVFTMILFSRHHDVKLGMIPFAIDYYWNILYILLELVIIQNGVLHGVLSDHYGKLRSIYTFFAFFPIILIFQIILIIYSVILFWTSGYFRRTSDKATPSEDNTLEVSLLEEQL